MRLKHTIKGSCQYRRKIYGILWTRDA